MPKKQIVFVGESNKFVPMEKVGVPVTDIAFQRGVGVFESLASYEGVLCGLNEHVKRLRHSANALGIKFKESDSFIKEKVLEGVKILEKQSKAQNVGVKIIVTGGDSGYLGIENTGRLFILFFPLLQLADSFFTKGVALSTVSLKRIMPNVKSLNYLSAAVAYDDAKKKDCYDALYLDEKDNILEGTTFNFGVIVGKKLITAKDGVLPGITMDKALRIAKKVGLTVVRKSISKKEMAQADEAFLTSSFREIMPVTKVDGKKVGKGLPGRYCQEMLLLYRQQLKAN